MFCIDCSKKKNCQETCQEIENYLEKENAKKGYSARHIRRKEKPYNPFLFKDDFFIKLKIKKIHKINRLFSDNWLKEAFKCPL